MELEILLSAFKKAEMIENLLKSSSTLEDWIKNLEENHLREIGSFNEPLLYKFLKNKQKSKIKIGDIAGGFDKNGYRTIQINNKRYYAHRLA